MMENNNGTNHRYIFKFWEYLSDGKRIEYVKTTTCYSDELQGVKEQIAMDLENRTGNRCECYSIVEFQDNYERGMVRS